MAGKPANNGVRTEKLLNTNRRCYRIGVLAFAVGKKVLVPKQLTRKHCNDMLVYIILHL
jgi:hypothetical protein